NVLAREVRKLRPEYSRPLAGIKQRPEEVGVVDAPQWLAAARIVGPLLAWRWAVARQHPYCPHYHLALRLADVAYDGHVYVPKAVQRLEILGHQRLHLLVFGEHEH